MQIVIEMTEDDYKKVQDGRAAVTVMRNAIRNGKVLPKGHGRLIDGDLLKEQNCCSESYVRLFTIVEADKEVDE